MGLTQKLGTIPLAILTDASNNVGIGAAPSGSYKLEVTGTSNFTGALRTASTINMTGTNAQLLQTTANSVAGDNVAVFYNSNANSYGMYIGAGSGTNHALFITDSTRTANLFKVQGNGLVSINTTSTGFSNPSLLVQAKSGVAIPLQVISDANGRLGNYFNSDFNASNTGTNFRMGFSAGSGNTGFNMQVYTAGETAGGSLLLNPSFGFVGVGVTPIYTFHAKSTVTNDWGAAFENGVTFTGLPIYGILNTFVTSPNNSASYFIYSADSTTQRFSVRSNGGIYNFQANDSNLSDINTKKDIVLLESYWDKFKAIEIVKFKYKDQTHDDYNIGVIAQQLEEIAPEFVDTDYWDDPKSENKTEMKSVFTTDLYHATIKVLQECMTKIEELKERIIKLENK
jgi:hypothetical protein